MKTERLIAMLAQGVEPVDRHALERGFAAAVAAGVLAALAGLYVSQGFGSLQDGRFAQPMFWTKLAFGLAVAASSIWVGARLARPGFRLTAAMLLPLLPVAALWLLATVALAAAAPGERAALTWGQTWTTCLFGIPALSVPAMIATLLAMRRMAPTRPVLAGAAAGAVAGGVGTAVYTLHCPELAAPFLAVWYVAAALIPVAAGAVVGRIALRW
jgi:hypothetical protein